MTPNKLPPLPEARIVSYQTDSTMRTTELRTYTESDMHAYAAEALRQSQSLPAGAGGRSESSKLIASGVVSPEYVGSAMAYLDSLRAKKETPSDEELPGMWSHQDFTSSQPDEVRGPTAGAVAGLVQSWRDLATISDPILAHVIRDRADELEQALQADAREKGESVGEVETVIGRLYAAARHVDHAREKLPDAFNHQEHSDILDAIAMIRRLATQPTSGAMSSFHREQVEAASRLADPTKIYPKAVSDLEECHRHSCKRKQAIQGQALGAIVSAVRRYLPPDGISKDELISAVIAAIDNQEINSELK